MDKQLQQLLDKQAINDVLQQCCRTMDWLDEPGQAACYWPDAQVDFGFFKGRADAFVPMLMAHQRDSVRRWHLATGALIKLKGDRAEAESYGITTGSSEIGEPSRMYGGRYLDELEKRDGQWRIAERLYILDWTQVFTNVAETTRLEGGAMHSPDISRSGHEWYRSMRDAG